MNNWFEQSSYPDRNQEQEPKLSCDLNSQQKEFWIQQKENQARLKAMREKEADEQRRYAEFFNCLGLNSTMDYHVEIKPLLSERDPSERDMRMLSQQISTPPSGISQAKQPNTIVNPSSSEQEKLVAQYVQGEIEKVRGEINNLLDPIRKGAEDARDYARDVVLETIGLWDKKEEIKIGTLTNWEIWNWNIWVNTNNTPSKLDLVSKLDLTPNGLKSGYKLEWMIPLEKGGINLQQTGSLEGKDKKTSFIFSRQSEKSAMSVSAESTENSFNAGVNLTYDFNKKDWQLSTTVKRGEIIVGYKNSNLDWL